MRDGIGFADMGKKLISQALAFGRAGHEACDIYETGECRGGLLRVEHVRQVINAMVRHFDDAYIRFDGAERKIRRFCSGFGDGIEKGALADVRKAYNADLQIGTHENSFTE